MKTDKNIDLEEVLSKLSTNEAKYIVISRAVSKGLTNNPKYIRQIMENNERAGCYKEAFELAKRLNDTKKMEEIYKAGILYYEKHEMFKDAAKLAEMNGDTEKANMYKSLEDFIKI